MNSSYFLLFLSKYMVNDILCSLMCAGGMISANQILALLQLFFVIRCLRPFHLFSSYIYCLCFYDWWMRFSDECVFLVVWKGISCWVFERAWDGWLKGSQNILSCLLFCFLCVLFKASRCIYYSKELVVRGWNIITYVKDIEVLELMPYLWQTCSILRCLLVLWFPIIFSWISEFSQYSNYCSTSKLICRLHFCVTLYLN